MEYVFPAWAQPLFHPKRFKAPKGGRGSSKSWSVAAWLVMLAAASPIRWLCTREFQKSVKQSVHKLLCDQVKRLGLEHKFVVTEKSIVGKNGAEFIFEGLHANVDQIKSLEGLDGVWVEEAETVSKLSWQALIPTVRKMSCVLADAYRKLGVEGVPDKVSSEIVATFNPREEDDATSVLFFKTLAGDPDCWSPDVNWQDNPFFSETTLHADMLRDYKLDADMAAHVWGGQFRRNSEAQIFHGKIRLEEFEPGANFAGPWYGMDFGASADPFSTHEYWAVNNTLYVYREAWGYGVDNDALAPLVYREIPRLAKFGKVNVLGDRPEIRGDCSRPETIAHLRKFGLNVVAAEKWPGCVEDGIAALRSCEAIVIHPGNCPQAAREARLYSWKVDKNTGKVTRVIVDAYNHFWDDCRYAMQDLCKTKEVDIEVTHEDPIARTGISPDLESFDDGMDSFLPRFSSL